MNEEIKDKKKEKLFKHELILKVSQSWLMLEESRVDWRKGEWKWIDLRPGWRG